MKDKDQENAVLWARIKILEEKQNKEVLDKYFPQPGVPASSQFPSNSSSSSSSPSASSSCPSTCALRNTSNCSVLSTCAGSLMMLQPSCCQPPLHHHCQHQQSKTYQPSTESSHLGTEMEKKLESAITEFEQEEYKII